MVSSRGTPAYSSDLRRDSECKYVHKGRGLATRFPEDFRWATALQRFRSQVPLRGCS